MKTWSLGPGGVFAASLLLAAPFLAGADGGCGGDDQGGAAPDASLDAAGEGGAACTPADCAGLAATEEAKVCADGTGLGRTACTRQATGRCAWDFPPCPGDVDGGVSDGGAHQCPALGCPSCADVSRRVVDAYGCEGCGCQPAPTDGGTPCTTDSDCALGTACGFPLADACLARGSCVASQAVTCQAYAQGCGCDGNQVNTACTGLPAGFVHRPVLKVGACTAAVDAGDAGDGGEACCPSTSNAYACTFPDGGSGMACHDPRLGCASSTVCGAGCDRVTRGTCGP